MERADNQNMVCSPITRIWWHLFIKVRTFQIRKIKWSCHQQNTAKYQCITECQVKIFLHRTCIGNDADRGSFLSEHVVWANIHEVHRGLEHDNAINVHHKFIRKTEKSYHIYHKLECYAFWHAHLLTYLINPGQEYGGISDKLPSKALRVCRKSRRREICNMRFFKECNKRMNFLELFIEWPLYENHPYVQ